MIAAEKDRRPSGRSHQPHVLLNGLAGGGAVAQHQIASILEPVRTEDQAGALGPGIARRRLQRGADCRWRSRGATEERGAGIVGQTDQNWAWHWSVIFAFLRADLKVRQPKGCLATDIQPCRFCDREICY